MANVIDILLKAKDQASKDINKELFESCLAVSDNKNLNESEAALVIIEKLWEKLRQTHRLKVVK